MHELNLNEIKEFIIYKTKLMAEEIGDRLPLRTTGDGELKYTDDGNWVGGFWIGLLNYCYILSGERIFLEYAQKPRYRLIDRLENHPDTLDHDVGFLFIPSEVARYMLTGSEESRTAALKAADTLLARFNEKGGFIRAWNDWEDNPEKSQNNRGRIIIDCMYNLPLLYWASMQTGDEKYKKAATAHARTCGKYIIRNDGTTFHTYIFDPKTGEPRYGETFQGLSNTSCWARGQAWALGGFAMAYRFTGETEFLRYSKKTADVFLSRVESDYIPVWDFDLRGTDAPRDASAAAVAASGLLELSDCCGGEERRRYREAAEKIVSSLWRGYTTKDDDSFYALIKDCVGFYKSSFYQKGEGLIYADYYFAEAVVKLVGKKPIL